MRIVGSQRQSALAGVWRLAPLGGQSRHFGRREHGLIQSLAPGFKLGANALGDLSNRIGWPGEVAA